MRKRRLAAVASVPVAVLSWTALGGGQPEAAAEGQQVGAAAGRRQAAVLPQAAAAAAAVGEQLHVASAAASAVAGGQQHAGAEAEGVGFLTGSVQTVPWGQARLLPPEALRTAAAGAEGDPYRPAAVAGVDVRLRQYQFAVLPYGERLRAAASTGPCRSVHGAQAAKSGLRVDLCHAVGSRDGAFNVYSDYDPTCNCRRNCKESDPRRATHDSGYAELLRTMGPLSIRIRLVGPEIVLAAVRREDKCHYSAPFRLNTPGDYLVESEVLYQDYLAYQEVQSVTPAMARTPLLEPNETRDKGKAIVGAEHQDPRRNLWLYSRREVPEGRELHRGKFRASKFFVWDQFTLHSGTVVRVAGAGPSRRPAPRCTPPYHARWVQTGLAPAVPDRERHTHFERHCVRCLYTWTPYECQLPAFTQTAACECMRSRKIAFVGDSHSRVTYTHLANFLARPRSPPWDPEVKHIAGRQLVVGFGTSVDLISDILLEKTNWRDLSRKYDVIIAGFGSWAFGGGGKDPEGRVHADVGRWTRSRYLSAAARVAGQLAAVRAERGTKVVWLGMPAYPPNQRRFAKLKGEYRTNPRLQLLNADVLAEMGRHGIPVVDSFAASHPLVHLSIDHNHHVGYVQDAILHMLLAVLCPE